MALLLGELLVRLLLPGRDFVPGRDYEGWTENTSTFDALMKVDPELGYVPKLDTMLYDERGLGRDRPEDQALPSGPSKVLWVGDSVTARRFIERGVRRLAAAPFTSWNGGVESYNAAQTAGYLARVLWRLGPDAVFFTLHHNDWLSTPVVFHDDAGRVHCRTLDREIGGFSPWWYRHCHLYRLAFGLLLARAEQYDGAAADAQVVGALERMRDLAATRGVPFVVLLLPPMRAEAAWSAADRARHAQALDLLRSRGIRHVDLLPGLRRGLEAGVDPQQLPGDWMHPSEAIAPFLAEVVVAAKVLPGS